VYELTLNGTQSISGISLNNYCERRKAYFTEAQSETCHGTGVFTGARVARDSPPGDEAGTDHADVKTAKKQTAIKVNNCYGGKRPPGENNDPLKERKIAPNLDEFHALRIQCAFNVHENENEGHASGHNKTRDTLRASMSSAWCTSKAKTPTQRTVVQACQNANRHLLTSMKSSQVPSPVAKNGGHDYLARQDKSKKVAKTLVIKQLRAYFAKAKIRRYEAQRRRTATP
jgi:hypothetical protein